MSRLATIQILNDVDNNTSGLVPDFVDEINPAPSKCGTWDEDVKYDQYSYNACRVPWRMALGAASGYGNAKTRASTMATCRTSRFSSWASSSSSACRALLPFRINSSPRGP